MCASGYESRLLIERREEMGEGNEWDEETEVKQQSNKINGPEFQFDWFVLKIE